jgi:hypothetical protein
MSILTVLLVIVLVGVLLWAINTYIPMQPTVRGILNFVVIVLLIIWLLQAFGLIHRLLDIRVGASAVTSLSSNA